MSGDRIRAPRASLAPDVVAIVLGPILLAWLAPGAALAQAGAQSAPGDARQAPAAPEVPLDPPPMPAAPALALTLEDALAIADREAIDLEIARLQVERSEAAERIAWAGILPLITGNVTYQRFDQPIQRGDLVVREENQITGQLVVSETLSLRSVGAIRLAEAGSDVTRIALEDARLRAHAAIARLFFVVLAARRTSELTRAQIGEATRQLEAARVRARVGVAIGLDVARAEVAALDALRRIEDADRALARAWDQLGDALGRTEPIDAVASTLPAISLDEIATIDRVSSARVDVRAAEASREQASRAIDDAWFRFVPSLAISWTGSATAPTTAFAPGTQWVFAASVSVPFYDGGARYGALRDAQLAVRQADERIEQARRRVRVEIRDALRRVASADRSAAIAARQADVARRAAEQAEQGYAAGALSGLELDAARRAAEQAELQRILADLERENARIDMLTASGDL
jgi:outer membrane protein TolC